MKITNKAAIDFIHLGRQYNDDDDDQNRNQIRIDWTGKKENLYFTSLHHHHHHRNRMYGSKSVFSLFSLSLCLSLSILILFTRIFIQLIIIIIIFFCSLSLCLQTKQLKGKNLFSMLFGNSLGLGLGFLQSNCKNKKK